MFAHRLSMTLLAFGFAVASASAQGTAEDYARANALRDRWKNGTVPFRPTLQWVAGTGGVVWRERSPEGSTRFVHVDLAEGRRRIGTDLSAMGLVVQLPLAEPRGRWSTSPSSDRPTSLTFENRCDRTVRLFWVDSEGRPQPYGTLDPNERREQATFAGHVWLADFEADDFAGVFVATADPRLARFDESSRRRAMGERSERSSGPRVLVRDHNVVLVLEDGTDVQLSRNGSETEPYQEPRWWSPDRRYVLGFQVRAVPQRRIPLTASAPGAGLQPELRWRDYRKPGDAIEQPRPRLFDVVARKAIAVDDALFANAWSIDRVRWSDDSSRVFCLYNRRGHDLLALRSIDAATGSVATVIEESSPTFVDYSQKTSLHWLPNDEVLWATERSGRNHLYRFDGRSGRLLATVTKGDFVVRRVEHVDPAARFVWFVALGIHPDQDPYHEHLARVDLDGRNLCAITRSDGFHTFEFSPDRSAITCRWSRVDHPPVTELRRTSDGSLVAELGRDDVSGLLAAGYRPPERFVAKARDGVTDIHGIIIRPSVFDPTQRYPILEDIYAGPHDHHVPKTWQLGLRQRVLAELGFIVVQIDGMGTNWRTKAFHDVCWRNLADAGFPDRRAWITAASRRYPEMNLSRVGIFGGSAGGQSALAALLHQGDFYHVAVADCGCHDNRMDKIWWNEAWMGLMGPHYAANSNVTHAHRLTGRLLLTVGELDENVDPASTLQVADALIRADKDFDLIIVPGAGHGVGESPYLVRRRQDFFVRNLLGVEPRL